MGIQTHVVVGATADADRVLASNNPVSAFPGFNAKGLAPVAVVALWCLLDGQPFDAKRSHELRLLAEGSEDGPWVMELPGALVRVLGEIPDAKVPEFVEAWATDPRNPWLTDRSHAHYLLDHLRRSAANAIATGQTLLMWSCE